MPTTGPNFPTAATGNTSTVGGGTVGWATPANCEASDGVFTTCTIGDTLTGDDLIGTGFNFAITSTDTINGILLEVNVKANTVVGGAATENVVKLLKAGTAAGVSRSTGAAVSTTAGTISYGGAADLWGTTWTPTDINNANFGAAVSYQNASGSGTNRIISVDFMRITITSTTASGTTAKMMIVF